MPALHHAGTVRVPGQPLVKFWPGFPDLVFIPSPPMLRQHAVPRAEHPGTYAKATILAERDRA